MSDSIKRQVQKLKPETIDLFLDAVQQRIDNGKITSKLADTLISDFQHVPKDVRNSKYFSTLENLKTIAERTWDFAIIDANGKEYGKAYLDAKQAVTLSVNQLEKRLLDQFGNAQDIKYKPISIRFNPESPIIKSLPTREPYRGL